MPNNKNKEVENTLIEQDGDTFSVLSTFKEKLLTFKGKNIILYFYPRIFTSGCTKLACNFRDYSSEFVDLDTIIIGIRPDSALSHQEFIQSYKLPYILIEDESMKIADMYGAVVEADDRKKIIRKTIFINRDGEIVQEWIYDDVDGHVEEILHLIKNYK